MEGLVNHAQQQLSRRTFLKVRCITECAGPPILVPFAYPNFLAASTASDWSSSA